MGTNSIKLECLVLMDDSLNSKYIETLIENLPNTLRPYLFLLLRNKWKRNAQKNVVAPRCVYNTYVLEDGDPKKCTFVALSAENQSRNQCIFAYTLDESGTELYRCFRYTQRIAWQSRPLIESIDAIHAPQFLKAIQELGLQLDDSETTPSFCLWMPKEHANAINYTIPNEYYIAELSESHSKTINDTWHFRDENTLDYIKSIIRLNGGTGLFDRNSNKLLSWILLNENMSPGCLYTIESARRKGLGKLLMQFFCKQFADRESLDILAYADADNSESMSLLQNLGFQILNECFWYRTQ